MQPFPQRRAAVAAALLWIVTGCSGGDPEPSDAAAPDHIAEAAPDETEPSREAGSIEPGADGGRDVGVSSEPRVEADSPLADVPVADAPLADVAIVDASAADAPVDAAPASVVRLGGPLGAALGLASAYFPAIAVDSMGRVWVAFLGAESLTGGTARVFVQRWQDGTWQTVGTFASDPPVDRFPLEPDLVVDASGQAVVAWTDYPRGGFGMQALRVRHFTGERWETWDDLPQGYHPTLVVDGQGRVTLAATIRAPSDSVRVYRRESGGAGWSPLGDMLNAADYQLSRIPTVAGNAAGALEVLWCQQQGTLQFLPQRRRWENGTWTVAPPLSYGKHGPASLMVGMNASGVTAYAWMELDDDPTVDWTPAVFMDGWPDRRLAVQRRDVSPVINGIAVDAMNRPIVMWSRSTSRTVFVDRWSDSAFEQLSGPMQGAAVPGGTQVGDLALGPNDRWFVAFHEAKLGGGSEVFVMAAPP
jgi:hypothetical protein